MPIGDAAAIRMGGVEAVLISNRAQAMGTDLFANVGIDPIDHATGQPYSTQLLEGNISRAVSMIYSNWRMWLMTHPKN